MTRSPSSSVPSRKQLPNVSDTEHSSVARVRAAFTSAGIDPEVRKLSDTARTAVDAANALDVEVGQIASSIVFAVKQDDQEVPVLVITSGRHRVDTALVSEATGLGKLHRCDADFVREWSGFAIGGVSPTGWSHDGKDFKPITYIDKALNDYNVVWAAAGHTHVVFQSTFQELIDLTGATPLTVAND